LKIKGDIKMEVVVAHEDEITLNTFLQLVVYEDGIKLCQNNIVIFKVSWKNIDEARKMFKKNE